MQHYYFDCLAMWQNWTELAETRPL